MTKHECRMSKEIKMTNDKYRSLKSPPCIVTICHCFVIRHSDFVILTSSVIRHSSL